MTPKQEAEKLMNDVLPVAKRMLREYGEFFPYGGYLRPDGEMIHVGAKEGKSDRPKSQDLISVLQSAFQNLVKKGQCKAIVIVYDVIVPLPKSNRKSNAVQICVDHIENYSAEVFIPYQISGDKVIFDEIFAQEGKHKFFPPR